MILYSWHAFPPITHVAQQRYEALDFRGEQVVYGMADAGRFAHDAAPGRFVNRFSSQPAVRPGRIWG